MRTINFKVSYEKMISRLPALFAFLEIDDNGVCNIVKATKGEQGNYGKIVANIRYNGGNFEYTCKDGTELKIINGERTYRTLIDVYYKAINDKEWPRKSDNTFENPFLAFMEKGIGLKYIGLSRKKTPITNCGRPVYEEFPLAPDYMYLGEAKTYYNKILKIKKQLDFWENHTKICKEDERYYQFLKKEFELMRGYDKDENGNLVLFSIIEKLIKECEEVSNEYFAYSTGTNLCLKFNVNLTNTIKDLGMVTPYITEWVAGKRYYQGDVVYHVDSNGYGMTWICDLTDENSSYKTDEIGRKYTEGFYEDETELIYFDDGSEITVGEETITLPNNWKVQFLNWVERRNEISESSIKIKGTCNSHLSSLRRFTTYMNRNEDYEEPNNYKDWLWYYRKGMIVNRQEKFDEMGNIGVMYGNDETVAEGIESIVGGSKPLNIVVSEEDNDEVVNLAVWGDVITEIKARNNDSTGIGEIEFTYWLGVHLTAKKDERKTDGHYDYFIVKTPFDKGDVHYKRGEKLSYDEYMSSGGSDYCEAITWYSYDDDGNYKYYFKDFKPDINVYDNKGNIIKKASPYGKNIGVKYTEKYIYYKGSTDMIVETEFSEILDEKIREYKKGDEISFDEYKLLNSSNRAKCTNGKTNLSKIVMSDISQNITFKEYKNGQIITFEEYLLLNDENKKKCKELEETIWTMVEKNKFNDYINGKFDKDGKPDESDDYKLYEKMEFDTSNSIYSYDLKVGNNFKDVPYIRTNFTTKVDITHVDIEETPLIRYDYYNGVSFQPSINEDVYVERGVTQAFEKHIKFGEIKTFEDFENYANGGFFVISRENIDLG